MLRDLFRAEEDPDLFGLPLRGDQGVRRDRHLHMPPEERRESGCGPLVRDHGDITACLHADHLIPEVPDRADPGRASSDLPRVLFHIVDQLLEALPGGLLLHGKEKGTETAWQTGSRS